MQRFYRKILTSRSIRLLVIFFFLCTSSCTSVRSIPTTSPQDLVYRLEIGDTVHVSTKSGGTFDFKITDITDDAIHGDAVQIPLEEIDSIEKKEFSTAKTVAAGASIVTVVAVAAFVGFLFIVKSAIKDSFK